MAQQDLFTITIEGVDAEMHVLSFHGSEGMSQLFDWRIEIASPEASIDFEAAIGKPALLTMAAGDDEPRYVHGLVSRFECTGSDQQYTLYAATLVPSFWLLGLRQDACIFQGLTTPKILKDVLGDNGLADGTDFAIDAQGSYSSREYCVQYRETDFAFLSRLMEEDGLFYWFDTDDQGHKLKIADTVDAYQPIAGLTELRFRHAGTGMTTEEAEVRNLRFARTLQVGRVELRAWNFAKTGLDLKQDKEADAEKKIEHYDYAGRYEDSGVGKARSQVRLESMRTRVQMLSGDSNCRHFVPGHRFTVIEHPNDHMNGEYVITRVSHSGTPDSGGMGEPYRNSFDAIPADVLFRAPQVTPRGRVEGPQTAIVTGESGEEIYVDSHGRVKVKFHWDRLGAKDEKSSCWVRVSQSHRINDLAIPRVGEEVIVDFLEGDPDQPIITGRVYNGTAQSPYALPADKTKSTFKTLSSPGGDGFNELRFEDAAGNEEIYVHAQKDWNTEVLNDRTTVIGHDQKAEIKNDKFIKVVANHTEEIGGNMDLHVKGNEKETIDGNRSIEVGGTHQEQIKGAMGITVGETGTISIGGDGSVSVGGKGTVSFGGDLQESAGGKMSVSSGGNYALSAGANGTLATAKKLTVDVGDVMGLSVAKDCTENIGKKLKVTVKDEYGLEAKKVTIEAKDEIVLKTGSASIALKKNGDITIEGGKINVKGSGDVIVKGSKITQN